MSEIGSTVSVSCDGEARGCIKEVVLQGCGDAHTHHFARRFSPPSWSASSTWQLNASSVLFVQFCRSCCWYKPV